MKTGLIKSFIELSSTYIHTDWNFNENTKVESILGPIKLISRVSLHSTER